MNPPSSHSAAARDVHPQPENPDAAAATSDVVESYRRLADVFHVVLSEQSVDALLQLIADTVAELIPCDDLHIYEADEQKRQLKAVWANGEWSDEVLSDEPFDFGEGITGWAVDRREPVLANDAHLHPRVRFVANTPADPESLIVVPLTARGRLRGALNLYRTGDAHFTEAEFQLAARFGDAAALALDNAHVRAQLERQAQTDSLTGLLNHRAFHDVVRRELVRASAEHDALALVMLDIDDFKRVNDVHGHGIGDQVLVELASVLRRTVRSNDIVCRIGGEEFAVLIPASTIAGARTFAVRLQTRLEQEEFDAAGHLSISIGVAVGPEHATNPRELVACAEAAMMTAKAQGKNRIVVFGEIEPQRPAEPGERDVRSIAHLKMLQSVGAKLNRLTDVEAIGTTIADELRGLIDYHNCRVFMRSDDVLHPIAFRGDLTAADGPALGMLETRVGVGITGRVVETGEPLLIGDAANCEFGHHIEGTAMIEESLLAVPLTYGSRVVGAIVVSQLGLDQFDAEDLRLMEVLAGHAAVALVNAELFETQRREAEVAKALLELSRALAETTSMTAVAERLAKGVASILDSPHAGVWLPDEAAGQMTCRASWSPDPERAEASLGVHIPLAGVVELVADRRPFLVEPADYEHIDIPTARLDSGNYALIPLALEEGWGVIAVDAGDPPRIGPRDLELLEGVAHQATLAIGNARSFEYLELTFLSTVEALAAALEAKDEYTSSHARWITDMALRVGRELRLDELALKRLELGALLHDIGKIGVPASILTKPGPLTTDERRVIQSHPELGERILAPIRQLSSVRPIVRACHEHWDGSGYPDGLRGQEIPLESRIILACDAFHAMTSDRPYRSALTLDDARRELSAGAGKQFDPHVVDVCLRVLVPPGRADGDT